MPTTITTDDGTGWAHRGGPYSGLPNKLVQPADPSRVPGLPAIDRAATEIVRANVPSEANAFCQRSAASPNRPDR